MTELAPLNSPVKKQPKVIRKYEMEGMTNIDFIQVLPIEVSIYLFSFLSLRSLAQSCLVSVDWNYIASGTYSFFFFFVQ